MVDYKAQDFEIIRFFSYKSTVPYENRTFNLMTYDEKKYPNIIQKFDAFIDALVDQATELWKEHTGNNHYITFHDNKTVLQIRHKFSGKIFFLGHYDFYRFIGTSCHLYDGYIFDFKTFKNSDFISDVFCSNRGILWKRFEI